MADTPLLGLCPIGKFVFSHEDALRWKAALEELLTRRGIRWVGVDDVIPDGVVRSQEYVGPVVRHLRAQGIDALFLPHCNFGTEGAAGVIARDLRVPTLLWGPRDGPPEADGSRLRDSLCGLFASSKVMRKLGATFTYIENCSPDEPAFTAGLDRFLAAAGVVEQARALRIGQIGQRIDFFWTTIVNESELLERFGVEVLPIDMVEFIAAARQRAVADRDAYLVEAATHRSALEFSEGIGDDQLVNMLAVRDAMLAVAHERGCDVLAVQSFNSICEAFGCMVEYACALVEDAGVPVACESDIHGAISSALLKAATDGTEPILFADLTVRHPTNDNAVLLWHCGFPASRRRSDGPASVGEHWILPGIPPGSCHWEMQPGEITVFRFDGDRGIYEAIAGEGRVVEGPRTLNTYCWLEVADWPAWERAFIEGPFIHHVAAAYGRHADAMQEAFRYIPGVRFHRLP